jgi:hypothetical protein
MTLTWASVPGITYRVLSRSSLTGSEWNPASPLLSATGAVTSWTTSVTNSDAFFTLSVSLDAEN